MRESSDDRVVRDPDYHPNDLLPDDLIRPNVMQEDNAGQACLSGDISRPRRVWIARDRLYLAKIAPIRLARSRAHELGPHGAMALVITPNWLRTRITLHVYGVNGRTGATRA
jgi:hypothetical protein